MSDSDENTQGNTLDRLELLKWVIRYVVMPLTLAVIAAVAAFEVAGIASGDGDQQPPNAEASATNISSATAVTPTSPTPTPIIEPTSTPTTEPTLTQELTPTQEALIVIDPPLLCGQVPAGWHIYIVQRGNTLYSLARNNGTTIDAIRQANCLNELIAGVPIWLPNIEPEPPTEPIALPDLINITEDMPTVSVDCSMRVACVTTVSLTVGNVGSVAAGSFNVQVMLDPAQSVELNQSIEFLEPGKTVTFPLTIPPGGSCLKGCTVLIIVDSGNVVVEENEGNNQVEITFPG